MQKRARWTISAAAAAGLFLTGAVTAFHDTTTPAPGHTKVAANSSVAPTINLDNCPTLTEGYHGGCVDQLQSELNADDHADLGVDGTFGAATRQAVSTFQQEHGVLPSDGVVGPLTKAALDVASSGGPSAPTPAPTAPNMAAQPSAPVPPLRYVALGDSYSSGEGLAPFLPGSDTTTDTCHRSDQAYPEYVTPKPDAFAACSGQTSAALTSRVMSGQEEPQDTQLNQGTGLVTFTFGGNDLDWPTVLWDCTKIQTAAFHNTWFYTSNACNQDLSALPGRIELMKANLITAYAKVLTQAPNAQVRALNYPPLFPDRGGDTSGCRIGRFGPIQLVIAHDVEQQVVGLEQQANQAIADAVSQVQTSVEGGDRLQLVDVGPQFGGYTGHTSSCGDTGRPTPWINSLRMSSSQTALLTLDSEAGNWDRLHTDSFDVYSASFHPTHEGQYEMYLALSAALPSGWR